MKNLIRLCAAALLPVVLGACGSGGGPTSQPEPTHRLDPAVRTPQPIVLGSQSRGCDELVGGSMLRAVELTVRSSTTITSLDAVSARGVTFGAPAYASQPAKIDGDPNYYDGGVFRGTRPPEHVPDAAFSPIQVLNWKHRKDLVGATLAPGRYYLFQTVRVPKAGGSVASWVFRWSAPDGTSGTTPWGQADRYAAHCRG